MFFKCYFFSSFRVPKPYVKLEFSWMIVSNCWETSEKSLFWKQSKILKMHPLQIYEKMMEITFSFYSAAKHKILKLTFPWKSWVVTHCVKSVRIWNFLGPYFPAIGINTERFTLQISLFSPNEGKIQTRKIPNRHFLRSGIYCEIWLTGRWFYR